MLKQCALEFAFLNQTRQLAKWPYYNRRYVIVPPRGRPEAWRAITVQTLHAIDGTFWAADAIA